VLEIILRDGKKESAMLLRLLTLFLFDNIYISSICSTGIVFNNSMSIFFFPLKKSTLLTTPDLLSLLQSYL
jgi:hypothetical protein